MCEYHVAPSAALACIALIGRARIALYVPAGKIFPDMPRPTQRVQIARKVIGTLCYETQLQVKFPPWLGVASRTFSEQTNV